MNSSIYSGKTVAITGGTGSLGKVLIETISTETNNNVKILVLSRDESKQANLRTMFPDVNLKCKIVDVRDKDAIEDNTHDVDIIIHAAALKRVDDGEINVDEFIKTNINGTHNVISAAIKHKCEKVILISSDKACGPINAYGATKKIGEKLFIEADSIMHERNVNTMFTIVRYGNIIASRGSVIPVFMSHAKQNDAIHVTHPDMTRFFMTLYDAARLVEYALCNTLGGDIFIPKMNSVNIEKMARKIIETLDSNSDIRYMGMRPGEKIHETLIAPFESPFVYDTGIYYCVPSQLRVAKYVYQSTSLHQFSSDQCIATDYDWIIQKMKEGGIKI